MSAGRIGAAGVGALCASLLSFAPGLPRGQGQRAASVIAEPLPGGAARGEEAAGPRAWPPAGVREVGAPPPADVKVEVARVDGGARVTVSRKGYLVALRHRDVATSGPDWATIELIGGGGAAADALVWEATDLARIETTRGIVHVTALAGGALPEARLSLAEAPARAPGDTTALRACASHEDGDGGFVVICRFGHAARAVRAVSVTGARPLEGVWVGPVGAGARARAAARLDLPRAPGGAEARAIGYVHGLTGIVLRAEATWAEGEAPSLLISEARRSQPTAEGSFFGRR